MFTTKNVVVYRQTAATVVNEARLVFMCLCRHIQVYSLHTTVNCGDDSGAAGGGIQYYIIRTKVNLFCTSRDSFL